MSTFWSGMGLAERVSSVGLHAALGMTLAATLLGAVAPARSTPFWVAWEGNALPEDEGWTRLHGPGGAGAVRTLEDGVMTLDGLQNPGGEYDGSVMVPTQGIQLDAGEMFVAEWRLYVEDIQHSFYEWDPTIGVTSDDGWSVTLECGENRVRGISEVGWELGFAENEWHSFRLETEDFQQYYFFMDGEHVRTGAWVSTLPGPRVAWGDSVGVVSSVTSWDYVRFGVIPEPGTALTHSIVVLLGTRRPRR